MYYIKVKTQFKGWHRWKDVPNIQGIKNLQHFHRHTFGVAASIELTHGNRDEEFILIQTLIDSFAKKEFVGKDLEYSCEQMAEMIFNFLKERKLKCLQVEVDEDKEFYGGYGE